MGLYKNTNKRTMAFGGITVAVGDTFNSDDIVKTRQADAKKRIIRAIESNSLQEIEPPKDAKKEDK